MAHDKPSPGLLRGALTTFGRPFAFAAKAVVAVATTSLRRPAKPAGRPGPSTAPWMLDTGKWTPELLKRLEWRRFEELCAAYFEALGFATRIARAADGGADIGLCAEGSEAVSIIVQCRAWNAYGIGIKPVQALREAMAAAQVGEGVLATSGRFTQEARKFAAKENIELIDGAELLAKIAGLQPDQAQTLLRFATEGDFMTPTCPSCGIKMISRKSTKAGRRYWGCPNYPRCKQIVYGTVNAPA